MRRQIMTLVALALVAGTSAWAQANWKNYSSQDGSFSVDVPTEVKYTPTPVKLQQANQEYTRHDYVSEDGGRAFVVQVATYPSAVNVSNPKVNLQNGLDNAAKQMEGGKWNDVRWTTYQGLAATDAVASKPPFEIRNYSILKGNTLYTLTYAGPPGSAMSADVNRFMNSFLVKK